MTARIFAIVPAMVLALGAGTAVAQPAAKRSVQFRQASLINHGLPLHRFEQAGAKVTSAAFVRSPVRIDRSGSGWPVHRDRCCLCTCS